MALPIKMNLDGNRILNEEGISNYTKNANYSSESNAIHNEYGFIELEKTFNLRIIGWKKIFGNQIILCSQATDNVDYACEIGILRGTDYSAIVRDNPAAGVLFNFDINNLIQIEAKLTINSETIIYFVDGLNADKFLNITKPQVTLDTQLKVLNSFEFKNMISFRLNSAANVYLDGTGAGGSLFSGVYYVLATLWNQGGLKTHSLVVSNPIPILPEDSYLDGAPAGTATNQKIDVRIKIDEIEEGYDFYTVYVISKINQVLKAYEYITSEIPPVDIELEISTLEAKTEVTPDSIILNSSDYISSLTLTQVDDVLFKGNLRSVDNFDFQPYINNIFIRYTAKQIELANGGYGNYDGIPAFYDKSFMYDEVYAFYVSLLIEENGVIYETKAYHIPGRTKANLSFLQSKYENERIDSLVTQLPYYTTTPDPSTIDCPLNQILAVDPDAKIFQALDTSKEPNGINYNMGYWENENEFYSNESKWLTLDKGGNPVSFSDFRGSNVRHHKFPEAYSTTPGKVNMIEDSNTVNILGVELENIVIPEAYTDKVKGFKLYYAKRDINNRTILGQSLAIPQHQKHRFVDGVYMNNIFSCTGSWYLQDIAMNTPVEVNLEGFAPTNIKRASFDPSIYNHGVYNQVNGFGTANYCYRNAVAGAWDSDHGFLTMHPFDTLSQNVRMNASHFKNICRLKGQYTPGSYADGTSSVATPSGWIYTYRFDNANPTWFHGIDRGEAANPDNFFYNNIRRISDIQLLENSTSEEPIGLYWRKSCEKRYVIDFPNRLRPGSTAYNGNTVGQDFAILTLVDPSVWEPPVGLYDSSYASPYLANICAYKKNIFMGFDNQILCSTGFAYGLQAAGELTVGEIYQIITFYPGDDFTSSGAGSNIVGTQFNYNGTPPTWTEGSVIMKMVNGDNGIYGGDTFMSYYGERTTIDFDPIFHHAAAALPVQELRTIHYYICQSTSNIRLRHSGTNSNEIYFPKNAIELDQLGGGFNNYYGYNIDYSSVNDLSQPVQELNRLDNDSNVFPNRIIKSQVNNPELLEDNYLIFNPGDVTDVGLQYGQIENLFNINNKLAIHLTNDLMLTMNKQQMDTSAGKAYIGAGDIFSVKPQDVNSNYYGGTIGRYSGIMTPYGYFFIDPLSYNVFNFDGDKLNVISAEGMERYFYNYSNFQFPDILNTYNKHFLAEYDPLLTYSKHKVVSYMNSYWKADTAIPVDNPLGVRAIPGIYSGWKKYYLPSYNIRSTVGSLGYTVAYDTTYDRVIFSKVDYTFLKDEKGLAFNYTGFYEPGLSQLNSYITFDGTFGYFSEDPIGPGSVPLDDAYFTPILFSDLYEEGLVAFNGFTLAYYPKIKSWVSFYSYIPELLIGGSQNFFSSKNNTVFEHNQKTSPYFYQGEPVEWFIEPLYKMQGVEQLSSFSIKTDKIYFNQSTLPQGIYVTQPNLAQSETFDSYFVYNKNQMSLSVDFDNTNTSRDVEGYFRLNTFRDFTKDVNPILFDITSNSKDQRALSLDPTKHWTKQRKFTDFWHSARFTKEASEFIDLGNKVLDANDQIDFGSFFTVQPKTVLVFTDEFDNVSYGTIDNYGSIVDTTYTIRWLFNTSFPAGTYNIKMFNGYNLSLLDTQANKKPSHR